MLNAVEEKSRTGVCPHMAPELTVQQKETWETNEEEICKGHKVPVESVQNIYCNTDSAYK